MLHRQEALGVATDWQGALESELPEAPPVERALRIAPVCKGSPAAREQGPRDQCKNPRRVSLE